MTNFIFGRVSERAGTCVGSPRLCSDHLHTFTYNKAALRVQSALASVARGLGISTGEAATLYFNG